MPTDTQTTRLGSRRKAVPRQFMTGVTYPAGRRVQVVTVARAEVQQVKGRCSHTVAATTRRRCEYTRTGDNDARGGPAVVVPQKLTSAVVLANVSGIAGASCEAMCANSPEATASTAHVASASASIETCSAAAMQVRHELSTSWNTVDGPGTLEPSPPDRRAATAAVLTAGAGALFTPDPLSTLPSARSPELPVASAAGAATTAPESERAADVSPATAASPAAVAAAAGASAVVVVVSAMLTGCFRCQCSSRG